MTADKPSAELLLGGLVPLTTLDFPGRLAAVVFCQGCPWRCRYCHNPHLIPRSPARATPWRQVRAFLDRRRGLLDGVVFSGGEPTLQPGLEDAVVECREMGFQVGLHTAGMYPGRLARLLPLLDWVGLDIKAPFAGYAAVTGVPRSGDPVRESLALLQWSGVDYECRTTLHPDLIGEGQALALAEELAGLGVRRYALQAFRPEGCPDSALAACASPRGFATGLGRQIAHLFAQFTVRTD